MTARRRIVLTGATGLVGTALARRLTELGYEVLPFRSRHDGPGGMNHLTGHIDRAALEGAHAVIHLAGESIAQRWNTRAKDRILASRRDGTRLLAETLAGLREKPTVFLSMSGISRYGVSRTEEVDEASAVANDGFLPEVAEAWEKATLAADRGGIRQMLPAFRLGLGGPIGGGRQRMSWIGLPDLVELILWAVANPAVRGPLNATAPQVVTQAEFARALGATLRRPSFLPAPGWAVALLFGQMGRETILGDLAVRPAVALGGGFRFATPDLASALRQALGG
jgi:NAD dependent epimerase/dehydratase family enzyme